MPHTYDITQPPLTLDTIKPGIWIVIWDHGIDRPVFIGFTLDNPYDARDQQSVNGHRIAERQLVGSHPQFTMLTLQMTGLDPTNTITSRRTYQLPVTTSFVNYADIRMQRQETIRA